MRYVDALQLFEAMAGGGHVRDNNAERCAQVVGALPDFEKDEHRFLLVALAKRGHVRMDNVAAMMALAARADAILLDAGAPRRGRKVA